MYIRGGPQKSFIFTYGSTAHHTAVEVQAEVKYVRVCQTKGPKKEGSGGEGMRHQLFVPSQHVPCSMFHLFNLFLHHPTPPKAQDHYATLIASVHFRRGFENMLHVARIVRKPLGARILTTDLSRAAAVPQLTKICATIGPASEQLPMLKQVVAAGMRIMRLNFSHATYEEADLRMKNLKLSPGKNNTADNLNLRAVMLDTQGPEIRTGSFGGGVKEITWEIGQKVHFAKNRRTSD